MWFFMNLYCLFPSIHSICPFIISSATWKVMSFYVCCLMALSLIFSILHSHLSWLFKYFDLCLALYLQSCDCSYISIILNTDLLYWSWFYHVVLLTFVNVRLYRVLAYETCFDIRDTGIPNWKLLIHSKMGYCLLGSLEFCLGTLVLSMKYSHEWFDYYICVSPSCV